MSATADPKSARRAPEPVGLPQCAEWRDRMLEAVVIAGALVGRHNGRLPAAARMRLLVVCRRSALLAQPPQLDVLGLLDQRLPILADRAAARRLVSRTMRDFVGTPWAPVVLDLALAIGHIDQPPPASAADAIKLLRLALGLSQPSGG